MEIKWGDHEKAVEVDTWSRPTDSTRDCGFCRRCRRVPEWATVGTVPGDEMIRNSLFVAVLLVIATVGCSSDLGGGPRDILPEGVFAPVSCADPSDLVISTACPRLPILENTIASAVVTSARNVADAAYGGGVRWSGVIVGKGITRDGDVSGSGRSGWATYFVSTDDVLAFDTTNGVCKVANRCDCLTTNSCGNVQPSAATDERFPAVDSMQAIAQAFAEVVEGETYDLTYDVRDGDFWLVARESEPNQTVKIDATSGGLIN